MVVRPLNHQNPIKKVGNQNHECIINDNIIQIAALFALLKIVNKQSKQKEKTAKIGENKKLTLA